MNNKERNLAILKMVAILYSIFFILSGILGIIFLIMIENFPIIIDPIEQLILILTGVIFLRGFTNLQAEKVTGKAFIFVGTIMGFVIGILASLEFLFIGLIGGLINEGSTDYISRLFSYFFNPALILGLLTIIPHVIMKQREIDLS
ncbi:MAG: hypothetical protein KAT16_07040 [Candidatus Heimdallarchaeota archaeon]|nr:hypothetical protein [Candidatus Heimdallarchaeota archaeon]